MRERLSDQEFHALYCPVKNVRSALFLVAYFSVTAFVGWKGLHRDLKHPSLVELLFAMLVVALLAKWLVNFTCFRERLVLGIAIVSLVTGEVVSFVPSVFSQYVETVKFCKLALSLVGLLVSLTMLVQSARSPKIQPNEPQKSIAGQSKRNFLIVLGVIISTILLYPSAGK